MMDPRRKQRRRSSRLAASGHRGERRALVLVPRLHASARNHSSDFAVALARTCALSAIVMLVAQVVRAVAHTASAFGWSDALAWDQFSVIALESRWGTSWRIQVIAAVFLLVASLFVRVHQLGGWILTSIAVVACAVSMPLLGHAASSRFGLFLHSAHILGAGVWLGTLGCLLLLSRFESMNLLRHFAPFALGGAAMVVGAGSIAAVQYIVSVDQLWTTSYGRALVLKLCCFAGVVFCGYRNWSRWSVSPAGAVTDRRTEMIESALALAIVLITSVLTELPHP
jgi:putative copper export protein